MPRRIIIIAIILLSVFALYLLALDYKYRQPEIATYISGRIDDKTQIKKSVNDQDYQQKVKVIIDDFYKALDENSLTREGLDKAKSDLLGLIVPAAFKDLHINLVLATTKISNFFISGSRDEWNEGKIIVETEKQKYFWLNN